MLTFREEESARKAFDEAIENPKWPRAADAWECVTWSIIHEPTIGDPVTESGNIRSFVFDGAKSIGMPTVQVLYERGEELIIIHDARFSDAKFNQAGHG